MPPVVEVPAAEVHWAQGSGQHFPMDQVHEVLKHLRLLIFKRFWTVSELSCYFSGLYPDLNGGVLYLRAECLVPFGLRQNAKAFWRHGRPGLGHPNQTQSLIDICCVSILIPVWPKIENYRVYSTKVYRDQVGRCACQSCQSCEEQAEFSQIINQPRICTTACLFLSVRHGQSIDESLLETEVLACSC